METISPQVLRQLIRDKYGSLESAQKNGLAEDITRLQNGEPLAYVIGWIPFGGLKIHLTSRPLIPRPETEWWTTELMYVLDTRGMSKPFRLLDLCAGTGAIGLSVLARFPHAVVEFCEIDSEHAALISKNIGENNLDRSRSKIARGNLFTPFFNERFDVIATNPPYIPESRNLEPSVRDFEPPLALYGGKDGLSLVRTIALEAKDHLTKGGELWMECDVENIEEARDLVREGGARSTEIRTDQYGRPRVVVGYYP